MHKFNQIIITVILGRGERMGGRIFSLKITNIMLILALLMIPVITFGQDGSADADRM